MFPERLRMLLELYYHAPQSRYFLKIDGDRLAGLVLRDKSFRNPRYFITPKGQELVRVLCHFLEGMLANKNGPLEYEGQLMSPYLFHELCQLYAGKKCSPAAGLSLIQLKFAEVSAPNYCISPTGAQVIHKLCDLLGVLLGI